MTIATITFGTDAEPAKFWTFEGEFRSIEDAQFCALDQYATLLEHTFEGRSDCIEAQEAAQALMTLIVKQHISLRV